MTSTQAEEFPTLGRYQVINRIASGGMAEVFLAKAVGAMGFQRLVAVKLIHANFTRDEEFVKMFIDEARIAMHLHHRNIVQVFDLDKVGDTYFIAMEFVHGVNLYDLYERIASKNRWIEPPMALYLVAEISKGLHFAHTRTGADGRPLGIIHRDISPQNVLLSFEGEVKITDFGIATAAERLHQTAAGIVKGKYAYMAPERLKEEKVDSRVDVFSVGVLLYELLVGENPFAGPSAVETIENVLGKTVPAPSERGAPVSRRLDEICLKALAKNPDERYASGQALADAVTEYAMELTHARKDMAAGDSAVTKLLSDLFPERANRTPTAADPKSLSLPGVEDPQTAEQIPPNGSSGLLETQEDLRSSDVEAALEEDSEDFDAPTVLKMTPVKGLPQIISAGPSGVDTLPPTHDPVGDPSGLFDASSGDPTTPTELPPTYESADPTIEHGPVAGYDDDVEDPFAQTLPSNSNINTMPEDDPIPAPVVSRPMFTPSSSPPSGSPAPAPYTPPNQSVSPPPTYSPPPQPMQESEQLVVPLGSNELGAAAPRRASKMNVVAGGLLAIAAIVVIAALLVVGPGETAIVEVPLAISTQPPGALVTVNGRAHPDPTPVIVNVIANQQLTIELQLNGFKKVTREINPTEGAALELSEKLEAVSGSLTIRPSPPEATVIVNDKDRGTGTVNLQGLELDKPIEVVVELDGHQTFEETVTLSSEEPIQSVDVKLEEGKSQAPARRKVILQAPFGSWANVYFRGRHLGTTPVEANLPVGAHTLRVVNDESGIDREINVKIPRRGSNEVRLKF
ncbi:MAG: protein kinase [Deltaproteobacteria bacterium]